MKEERHKESLPLLQEGKEHPVQHHRRPVAVLLFPFLAAGVFALGFAGEYGPSFLELFKAKKKSMVTGADLAMFKRTHLSIDAIREGDWLVEKMDMGQVVRQYFTNSTASVSIDRRDDRSSWEEEAMKGHGHNALKLCASRSEFTWNSQDTGNYYSWHEFQGSQTETGPLAPDYWWDLIYKGSTEGLADDEAVAWNVFLHQGQHMYVPDLSLHMAKFQADGTPHLARRYKSHAKGDEGRTMYVAFVPNRFNGQTIIIHAPSVEDETRRAKFVDLEAEACSYAVSLAVSVDRLQEWWKNVYIEKSGTAGISRPIPVMDTKPTVDIDEVKGYFDDKIELHKHGATTALHVVDASSCKVFDIHMASQLQTEYQARFVWTPAARNFDLLGDFVKYTDATVREAVGFNTGYSRWMDDHWGISGVPLDTFRHSLEAANTPYHAHVTEIQDGVTWGSLWAWGVAGMAIEWHGYFDYSTFHDPIGNFDFCTADTACTASDYDCNLNTTDAGGTGASSVGPGPF